MTESIWDDPELKSNDDYVKFENVGDTITGKILSIRKHVFDDGKAVPQLLLDTPDGEKSLTAGQVRLKAALAEQRPGVGDVISVTLSNIEKRAGGKTLKHFDVIVGGLPTTEATPTPAPSTTASQVADPAAAAAALAGLTPEQKAALGIG